MESELRQAVPVHRVAARGARERPPGLGAPDRQPRRLDQGGFR